MIMNVAQLVREDESPKRQSLSDLTATNNNHNRPGSALGGVEPGWYWLVLDDNNV